MAGPTPGDPSQGSPAANDPQPGAQPPGAPGSGYPQGSGSPSGYPSAGYPQGQGYPPTPGYPPGAGSPQGPGYPNPGYQPAPGYPGYPPSGYPQYPPSGYPAPGPYGQPWVPVPIAGPVYGSFARRFGALILDSLALGVMTLAIGAVLHLPGFNTVTTSNGTTMYEMSNTGASTLVFGILSIVYFLGTWIGWGASPAQKLLGLRVCQETGPVNLTPQAAAIRWAILFGISSAIGAVAIVAPDAAGIAGLVQLGWIIALAVTTWQDRRKQGWHDRYAHSVVVRA